MFNGGKSGPFGFLGMPGEVFFPRKVGQDFDNALEEVVSALEGAVGSG
jgi:hypothetical protein